MLNACPLYPQKRTLTKWVAMSALCQKRTLEHVRVMSALAGDGKHGSIIPNRGATRSLRNDMSV
jgi:hypothetical protein